MVFDQSERAQGPIYIIKHNRQYPLKVQLKSFHFSGQTLGFDAHSNKPGPFCSANKEYHKEEELNIIYLNDRT